MNISPIRLESPLRHVFRFSLTTRGTTGEEWINFFYDSKILIGTGLKRHLNSAFIPTNGVTHSMLVVGSNAMQSTSLPEALSQKEELLLADMTIEGMCLALVGLNRAAWVEMRLEQIIGIQTPVQGLDCDGWAGFPFIRAPWKSSRFFGAKLGLSQSFCRATGFAYFE